MKRIKSVGIVFICILTVVVAFLVAVRINLNSIGMKIITEQLEKLNENNPEFSFEVGKLEQNSSKIVFNDVVVSKNGNSILTVDDIYISSGIIDVAKSLISQDQLFLGIDFEGINLSADSATLSQLAGSSSAAYSKDIFELAESSGSIGLVFTKKLKFDRVYYIKSSGLISTDYLGAFAGRISTEYEFDADIDESGYTKIRSSLNNLSSEKLLKEERLNGTISADGLYNGLNSNAKLDVMLDGTNFRLETETVIADAVAEVRDFTVDFYGFSLNYKGSINLETMTPDGQFALSELTTEKRIANAVFNLNSSRQVSFSVDFPSFENFGLNGLIYKKDENSILAETVLNSGENIIPFNLSYYRDEVRLCLDSSSAVIDADFKNGSLIKGTAVFEEFEYKVNDKVDFKFDGSAVGSFDIKTRDYDLFVDDFKFTASDFFFFGFDMSLKGNELGFNNILVGAKDIQTNLTGDINLEAKDFLNLIKGNLEDISFTSDLKNANTDEHFIFSFDGQTAFVDVYVGTDKKFTTKVLYDPISGLMGSLTYDTITFDADYHDGVVRVYNPKGTLGPIVLDDFNFNYDLKSKIAYGDGKVSTSSEVEQGGNFTYSGSIDQLTISSLSVDGIDASGKLHVDVYDAFLGDGFSFKDNSFDLSFHKADFNLSGEVINGTLNIEQKQFNISVDKSFLFGFDAKGTYGKQLDIMVSNVYFPISIVDQFIDVFYLDVAGSSLEGDFIVKGDSKNPSLFGMLYTKNVDFNIYWVPDQVITTKGLFITLNDHTIGLQQTPVVGYREKDRKHFTGTLTGNIEFDKFNINFAELLFKFPKDSLEFWFPSEGPTYFLNIVGDVNGDIGLVYTKNNGTTLTADILASDVLITFEEPENFIPYGKHPIRAVLNITTGKNVELAYPNVDDSFITVNTEEGQLLHLDFDRPNNIVTTSGKAKIKTGRLYYFSNDFIITDGVVSLDRPLYEVSSKMLFTFDLTAKLREYDFNGKPVDIYLIAKDSDLKNLQPRLDSSAGLSQNEILQILRNDILQTDSASGAVDVVSTIASSAVYASDVLGTFGVMDSLNKLDIASYIRNTFGLDLLSVRIPVIQNLIIRSLSLNDNESFAASILNGSSIFAGKYYSENLFARLSAQLKSGSSSLSGKGMSNFLTDDLFLNLELSLDWENSFGTYSVFVQPQELSVSSFLDNIGFSYNKTIEL